MPRDILINAAYLALLSSISLLGLITGLVGMFPWIAAMEWSVDLIDLLLTILPYELFLIAEPVLDDLTAARLPVVAAAGLIIWQAARIAAVRFCWRQRGWLLLMLAGLAVSVLGLCGAVAVLIAPVGLDLAEWVMEIELRDRLHAQAILLAVGFVVFWAEILVLRGGWLWSAPVIALIWAAMAHLGVSLVVGLAGGGVVLALAVAGVIILLGFWGAAFVLLWLGFANQRA